MHRKRHQQGSLQVRSHGKRKMWVVLYRDGRSRRYATLGLFSKLSKSEAQEKRDAFMNEVNARQATAPDPNLTFGEFVTGIALPFLRSKWKRSTASTTESRIHHHLLQAFGQKPLSRLSLKDLQAFLNAKATTHSRSVVAHLRWDLHAIFKLAMAEGYSQRDPTAALYTTKVAPVADYRAMTKEEVQTFLSVLDRRERVIGQLAIFAGMRPGEILALQRKHVAGDGREVRIAQRIYRGDLDCPKTDSSKRGVEIPPQTAALLAEWMECVGSEEDAWVFGSENDAKPLWRDNVWYRYMKPRLQPVGLAWANFQAMRRTHASLGHDAGIDPKVAADQRGHGIGVAIDVYTRSGKKKRAEAAEQLEKSVLTA